MSNKPFLPHSYCTTLPVHPISLSTLKMPSHPSYTVVTEPQLQDPNDLVYLQLPLFHNAFAQRFLLEERGQDLEQWYHDLYQEMKTQGFWASD
jgi:hypothetical protein